MYILNMTSRQRIRMFNFNSFDNALGMVLQLIHDDIGRFVPKDSSVNEVLKEIINIMNLLESPSEFVEQLSESVSDVSDTIVCGLSNSQEGEESFFFVFKFRSESDFLVSLYSVFEGEVSEVVLRPLKNITQNPQYHELIGRIKI